jgi:hypothetical protein
MDGFGCGRGRFDDRGGVGGLGFWARRRGGGVRGLVFELIFEFVFEFVFKPVVGREGAVAVGDHEVLDGLEHVVQTGQGFGFGHGRIGSFGLPAGGFSRLGLGFRPVSAAQEGLDVRHRPQHWAEEFG